MLATHPANIPDSNQARAPAQIADMPVRCSRDTPVMADPGAKGTRAERGADIDLPAGPEWKNSQAADVPAAALSSISAWTAFCRNPSYTLPVIVLKAFG